MITENNLITVLLDAKTAISTLISSIESKDSLDREEIQALVQRIKRTQSQLVDDIVYCNRQIERQKTYGKRLNKGKRW